MRTTVTRTYLELTRAADLDRTGIEQPAQSTVVRRAPVTAARFRALYASVGSAFHWHDRDEWTDEAIETRFAGDRVTLWELSVGGTLAGFYELERHEDGSVEIVLFGLLPSFAGRGIGKWLLADAAERALAMQPTRVWLHTCTLDSPAALPNYQARGFRPYRTEAYDVER